MLAGMTVLEVIQRSTTFLARKGVEAPRLQVELLLAHVLQIPRLQLYLRFDQLLADAQLDTLRELVRRRGQREPLQHLLGTAVFCGLDLAVDCRVLIPRPETELLAEQGWKHLETLALQPTSVLDFGTGSGCLAVVLAARVPSAQVHALEIAPEALDVARENSRRHKVADRITFHLGDGFAALPAGLQFNLIVANPPYVPTLEIDRLAPEVRDHDPRLALDGGADGLDFYRRLASEAAPFLQAGGRMLLELGDRQAEAVQMLFAAHKWIVEAVLPDYSGVPRILRVRPD
jgi:release factor glutamine methyltransferase